MTPHDHEHTCRSNFMFSGQAFRLVIFGRKLVKISIVCLNIRLGFKKKVSQDSWARAPIRLSYTTDNDYVEQFVV